MTEPKTMNICPDCKNQFVQPFKCTTCGAQQLYDNTVHSQYETIATQSAQIERLREALKQAAEDLQLVGDDYPGSSCHRWCSESAEKARAALKETT